MKKIAMILVASLALFALVALPVSADQTGVAVVTGNTGHTDVDVSNTVVTNNEHATYNVNDVGNNYGGNTQTNNYYAVYGTSVAQLSKNNIVVNRIILANDMIEIPVNPSDNVTYYITSGTPVAVYTIEANDLPALYDDSSKFTYEKYQKNSYDTYGNLIHGAVKPVDVIPYFTSLTHIKPTGSAAYLVIDNRYYPQDSEIQIGVPGTTTEL